MDILEMQLRFVSILISTFTLCLLFFFYKSIKIVDIERTQKPFFRKKI